MGTFGKWNGMLFLWWSFSLLVFLLFEAIQNNYLDMFFFFCSKILLVTFLYDGDFCRLSLGIILKLRMKRMLV